MNSIGSNMSVDINKFKDTFNELKKIFDRFNKEYSQKEINEHREKIVEVDKKRDRVFELSEVSEDKYEIRLLSPKEFYSDRGSIDFSREGKENIINDIIKAFVLQPSDIHVLQSSSNQKKIWNLYIKRKSEAPNLEAFINKIAKYKDSFEEYDKNIVINKIDTIDSYREINNESVVDEIPAYPLSIFSIQWCNEKWCNENISGCLSPDKEYKKRIEVKAEGNAKLYYICGNFGSVPEISFNKEGSILWAFSFNGLNDDVKVSKNVSLFEYKDNIWKRRR